MTVQLGSVALAISGTLFNSIWEGTILFAVVWLALRIFSKLSAATRYAIWLCTLLALIVVPVFTVLLAGHTEVSSPQREAAATVSVDPREATAGDSLNGSFTAAQDGPAVAAAPSGQSSNAQITVPQTLAIVVALAWAFFATVRCVVLALNFYELAKVQRDARVWPSRYAYTVWISTRISVPLAIGFLRPGVFLPASVLDDHSPEAVEAIIMHELAHLQRYDVWSNAVARVAEAFVAVNPVAWLVLRQLSIEREIACDDFVVARLGNGDVFARALATIAAAPHGTAAIAAPSVIGSRHSVVARIERLLDTHPRRLRLSLSALGGAMMFLALIAILMQTISPVLAYAPQPVPPTLLAAAGCSIPNRPVQMETTIYSSHGKKASWISPWPASSITKYFGADKVAILDVTVDASGKLQKAAIVSSPDPAGAKFAVRQFTNATYRPALKNCTAVASTFRTGYPVRSNRQRIYSVVAASYPAGWGNQHPSACRVPNLIHDGAPAIGNIRTDKPLSAAVRVDVNGAGAVTDASIVASSKNSAFDEATLAAARAATYPLNEGTGFKPVRPSGADLSWNASHGYDAYSKCSPLPSAYVWTANVKPSGSPLIGH